MKVTRLAMPFALLATPLWAAELATGAQIADTITGNTVQGSMDSSGAYTEFYQSDGTIRAESYTGAWSIEGDTMCFDYGEGPAECWGLKIDGETVTWIKDGEDLGTGTVLPGNPNGY
ncbi:hypothetical protein [Roseovarius aestuariivivens]|uniref:hypothetical protein n=1 Tax=Roseovarius aestuariivivens TaxID=1888910 RepID=UPI001080B7C7|nr:hypothetical protein [Roseovarius aestuariivivens]